MSSFTKGRVALFPGNESNWCVYTINGREQSTFSGEIWTPQQEQLLLPLNQAVHFRKSYMIVYCFMLNSLCYNNHDCSKMLEILLHFYVVLRIHYSRYCMCLYWHWELGFAVKHASETCFTAYFRMVIVFLRTEDSHLKYNNATMFFLHNIPHIGFADIIVFSLWQDDAVDATVDPLLLSSVYWVQEDVLQLVCRILCQEKEKLCYLILSYLQYYYKK